MKFKSSKFKIAAWSLFLLLLAPGLGAKELSEAAQQAALRGSIKLLALLHFEKPTSIGNDFSESIFKKYVESLDPDKVYFLSSDIEELQKYADDFFPAVRRGDPSVIRAIYGKYQARVAEGVETAHQILGYQTESKTDEPPALSIQALGFGALGVQTPESAATPTTATNTVKLAAAADPKIAALLDFTQDETLSLPFKTWLASAADREARLRSMIRGDLLTSELLKENLDDRRKLIGRRYDRLAKHVKNTDSGEIIAGGLESVMHRFDPHTDYFGPTEATDFNIRMHSEQLIGIGAILGEDDGDTVIESIVTGGPAAKDGRLKVGDKIIAVSQGDDAPVDVREMEMPDVVAMIRGTENTVVKLSVVPKAKPTEKVSIELTRKVVELEDQEATGKVVKVAGSTDLVGVIALAQFYEHCSDHIAKLIADMKNQKVSAIILDLRGDGGGYLPEAVKLTHLFVKEGPVVLARYHNPQGGSDVKEVLPDEVHAKSTMVYDGPLVVMIDELTASASEIVAAALQDYHRALIVGSKQTHGKGTIQRPDAIQEVENVDEDAGTLHVTTGEFYRITGHTTQYGGVASDITIPSIFEGLKTGERNLDYALKPREVEAEPFTAFEMGLMPLTQLKKLSAERVASDPEFGYLKELLVERAKTPVDELVVSLSKEKRQTEIAAAENKEKTRDAERKKRTPSFEVVKNLVIHEADRKADSDPSEKDVLAYVSEAQLAETVNIAEDWLNARGVAAKHGVSKNTVQDTTPAPSFKPRP